MADESKALSAKTSTLSTGGCGAILSVLVSAVFTDPNDPWRQLAYAAVPFIAAIITYFMSWVVSRHGLESPEDASKRAKCYRDLKTIDKQLKFRDYSPEFRNKLIADRERTVSMLVNIGKESVEQNAAAPEQNG